MASALDIPARWAIWLTVTANELLRPSAMVGFDERGG